MTEKVYPLGIPMTAEQYAEHWEVNSRSYHDEGYYSWMSDQLENTATVLEVGCGSGNGTRALVKKGRHVIAVEPNKAMAELALKRLEEMKIPVELAEISSLSSVRSDSSPRATIFISDIFDEQLDGLINGLHLDAVVCWLIGAEPARIAAHIEKPMDSFEGSEAAAYREKLHKRCYELGKICLKPNGLVHFVDRQGIGSWNDKDHARQYFSDYYSNLAGTDYDIKKSDVLLKRLHSNMAANSRIQYISLQENLNAVPVFGSVKAKLIHK